MTSNQKQCHIDYVEKMCLGFFSSTFPSSFQKLEDTELELKPLPAGRLVTTPDGLPNDTFGDIAMITEFISCYSGLLMPNNQFPIHTG